MDSKEFYLRQALRQHMVHRALLAHKWRKLPDTGPESYGRPAVRDDSTTWLPPVKPEHRGSHIGSIDVKPGGDWEHWEQQRISGQGKGHESLIVHLKSRLKTESFDDPAATMHFALRSHGWTLRPRGLKTMGDLHPVGDTSWFWEHPERHGHKIATWSTGSWKHYYPARVGLNHTKAGEGHELPDYLKKVDSDYSAEQADLQRRYGMTREDVGDDLQAAIPKARMVRTLRRTGYLPAPDAFRDGTKDEYWYHNEDHAQHGAVRLMPDGSWAHVCGHYSTGRHEGKTPGEFRKHLRTWPTHKRLAWEAVEQLLAGEDVEQVIEATFHTGTRGVVARRLRLGSHSQPGMGGMAHHGARLTGYKVPKAQIQRARVKARKTPRPQTQSGRDTRARLHYADRLV